MNGSLLPAIWLVWNKDGKSPWFEHTNAEQAKAEARRLAMEHPSHRFTVVQAIATFVSTDPVTEITHDDIPF